MHPGAPCASPAHLASVGWASVSRTMLECSGGELSSTLVQNGSISSVSALTGAPAVPDVCLQSESPQSMSFWGVYEIYLKSLFRICRLYQTPTRIQFTERYVHSGRIVCECCERCPLDRNRAATWASELRPPVPGSPTDMHRVFNQQHRLRPVRLKPSLFSCRT